MHDSQRISPFHNGERDIQIHLGIRDQIDDVR